MSQESIDVLRLGYRLGRDPRITTHLALVSRAMGVSNFILCGDEDNKLFENIDSVNDRFGHGIAMKYEKSPMKYLKDFSKSGTIVHLTMYGEKYKSAIDRMPRDKPVVVIVGGSKVPGDIFKVSDYNVSVGNQPHSEVAALALFLEHWTKGEGLENEFSDAKLTIEPSADAKIVHEND